MKLILFLIIVAIIYFIASQIKMVHIGTLPKEERAELNNRSKIKSALQSYIRCNDNHTEKFANLGKKPTYRKEKIETVPEPNFPNATKLIKTIKSEFLNNQYKFNLARQPVTTRYPNKNTKRIDNKYIKHIKKNINAWNNIFTDDYYNIIKVKDIRLICIIETTNEFIIKANVQLLYLGKTLHIELSYYGQIEKSDDFLNGQTDVYQLQLLNIKPITKSEFEVPVITAKSNHNSFMTMDEQMKYVDKINRLHQNETTY